MNEPAPKPKLVKLPEPWTPAKATERLREMAGEDTFSLVLTGHAEERMEERDITTPDILYVLRTGFVYEPAEPATRVGMYKYQMVGPTPNSNKREIRVVVIPALQGPKAKIATVMWANEPIVKGG